jgi:hypothetical protein
MDVDVWEHHTTLTPLSLLISYKSSSPVFGLKKSSLLTLQLKSLNKIVICYLGKLSKSYSNQFYPLLGHEHSKQ